MPIPDESKFNTVDILISYATGNKQRFEKTYTAAFKPDTGIQQYLDYYQEGFLHDHPEAIEMEIVSIEAYHNDKPENVRSLYKAEGKHKWQK